MARSSGKTVRFTQVVERSGEPHVHTLWLPPEKDPELQRARKSDRVMTVSPGATGGKTDVGVVGFAPAKNQPAQFLIFPRSLARFEGARVVGIKFDLVARPKPASESALKRATAARTGGRARKRKATVSESGKRGPSLAAASDDSATGEATRTVVPFELPRNESAPDRTPPPPARRARPSAPRAARQSAPSRTETALRREVRAAMKELQRGKSVAAYQRLERAMAKAEAKKR